MILNNFSRIAITLLLPIRLHIQEVRSKRCITVIAHSPYSTIHTPEVVMPSNYYFLLLEVSRETPKHYQKNQMI